MKHSRQMTQITTTIYNARCQGYAVLTIEHFICYVRQQMTESDHGLDALVYLLYGTANQADRYTTIPS